MEVAYKSVLASASDIDTDVKPKKHGCCTKLRIISAICVLLVLILIVMYTCLDHNNSGICCLLRHQKIQTITNNIDNSWTAHNDKVTDSNNIEVDFERSKRRFPDAIIIGVRKGGTRAMIEYLRLHPQIAAVETEVHFFDREENYSRGMDWYRRHMPFSTKQQITIEKTPSYFTTPKVPGRVYEMNPDVKMILLLRDPLERAISDYTQIYVKAMNHGTRQRPFKFLAIDTRTGSVRRSYVAVKRSLYYRHLSRWLEYFSLDNFLIIDTQELIEKPLEAVHKAEKFLGLQHRIKRNNFYYNDTKGFYCIKTDDSWRQCLSASKGRPHVHVDRGTKEKLRQFFRPYNKKLYRLLGRDFGW